MFAGLIIAVQSYTAGSSEPQCFVLCSRPVGRSVGSHVRLSMRDVHLMTVVYGRSRPSLCRVWTTYRTERPRCGWLGERTRSRTVRSFRVTANTTVCLSVVLRRRAAVDVGRIPVRNYRDVAMRKGAVSAADGLCRR